MFPDPIPPARAGTIYSEKPEPALPPLAFWKARSFWLSVFSAASAAVSAIAGLDPALVYTMTDAAGIDREAASGVLGIVAGLSALLAWRERLNPKRRLALNG